MEEDKAAAYYEELTRKGEGAARFKQGLGFSSNTDYNDVPTKPSSSSSFLSSSFVKASSPATLDKHSRLQSVKDKLNNSKASLSKRGTDRDKRRSPSKSDSERDMRQSLRKDREKSRSWSRSDSERRNRDRDRRSKRRSRSRSDSERDRDRRHSLSKDRERRRRRSRSRSVLDRDGNGRRSRSRDRERLRKRKSRSRSDSEENRNRHRDRGRSRSMSPVKRKSDKKEKNRGLDYAKLIRGYDDMSAAERVKAKMKFQLSETAEKDAVNGMGSGWERFEFDKDAPLDDEEMEVADDDAALVKRIDQSFRFSTVEANKDDQIKAAHDEAMFGSSHVLPSIPTEHILEEENESKSMESTPELSLLSDKVIAGQRGSWRDRARKA